MLNQIDLQRLIKLKQDIALIGLRFPVATIAKRTRCDKGSVSKALNGKEPCSNNLISRFYSSFGDELDKARTNRGITNETSTYLADSDHPNNIRAIAKTLSELAASLNQIAQSINQ